MCKDRDHLIKILQICGSPDEELTQKIEGESVSAMAIFLPHALHTSVWSLLVLRPIFL